MVTIVWIGKPSHKGLGSIFLAKAKKNINVVAYVMARCGLPSFRVHWGPILGLAAVALVFASVPVAVRMNTVSNRVFGGVFGDMIGATNEVARAITFILFRGGSIGDGL